MIAPSFFIIGAPKGGTTAMSQYLSEHPDVVMCVPKEPFFFATDLPSMRKVTSMDAYLELFPDGAREQCVAGEGSTLYLFSQEAVPAITDFDPTSKLIVMLRNPVVLVQAFHSQLLYGFFEDEPDFARAWQLQPDRLAGRSVPPSCPEPALLQYAEIGALGSQVERLLGSVARERVLLLVFDDFARDPAAAYREVVRFLGLTDDGRTSFPKENASQTHRFRSLAWLKSTLFRRAPGVERAVLRAVRAVGLERAARSMVARPQRRPEVSAEVRAQLVERFTPEIEKLGDLLHRSFDDWLADGRG